MRIPGMAQCHDPLVDEVLHRYFDQQLATQ